MPAVSATPSPCPACAGPSQALLTWPFSGLGDSVFNYSARFHACPGCGLVFIDNVDDAVLARFYAEECGYFDKPHFAVTSPANQAKYAFYAGMLRDNGIDSVPMADVGCGRGGFVNWLADGGWRQACWGVDVDARSLPETPEGTRRVAFRNGGALALPFPDASLELLTYFHVLEHIHDLAGLLGEARRVLASGGHVLVEVPDAEGYARHPIGSAFWISIREHVHHFTARALASALVRQGFQLLRVSRQSLPTPEFSYPSLMLLARKGGEPGLPLPPLEGDVAEFARQSRLALKEQARAIVERAGDGPITVWGCSAEVFSLLPLLDMRRVRLCDASPLKQRARYGDLPVADPAALPVEGLLVVAPYLHRAAIRRAALGLGWPEDALFEPQ